MQIQLRFGTERNSTSSYTLLIERTCPNVSRMRLSTVELGLQGNLQVEPLKMQSYGPSFIFFGGIDRC